MAHICTLEVPEKITKLMESLGFHQVAGISPEVHWVNFDGSVRFSHHQSCHPRSVDEVIKWVYNSGYNVGSYDQIEATKATVHSLVDSFLDASRLRIRL